MKKLSISLLALSTLLIACPDSKAGDDNKEVITDVKEAVADAKEAVAEVKEEAKEAAADGLKLEKFGLTIAMPADATVMDMLGTLMITGGGTVVSVAEVKADGFDPKTFEEAKEAKSDYSPTKVTKEEKTEDGWLITFENMGGGSANFFVWARRTIDGKAYKCETTVGNTDQAAKAEAACATLKK